MFANATRYRAQTAFFVDEHGVDSVVVMAKATYERRGVEVVLAEEQIPVRLMDVPTHPEVVKENGNSSLRYFGELAGNKQGADIVVVGSAISAKPVQSMDVAVRTPAGTVPLRVFGERYFYRSAFGTRIAPAAPFEKAPITYERAYGGTSKDGTIVDAGNPVGRGVHKTPRELEGELAPCIEDPARPIDGTNATIAAGYGAIASWWSPRTENMGTMDRSWQTTRLPVAPSDFNPRFYRVAHPRLQLDRAFRPGDVVATNGLCTEGLFEFRVPRLGFVAFVRRSTGGTVSHPLIADTLLLEPEPGRVELTFRSVVPVGRGATLLKEIRLDVDA